MLDLLTEMFVYRPLAIVALMAMTLVWCYGLVAIAMQVAA